MKFIHTGDLHLDSPFRGLANQSPAAVYQQIQQSTYQAFARIVDLAIDENVDFMLIVGDIFDRDHHSVKAADFFTQQCRRLAVKAIPVYLSYGNHDYQNVADDTLLLPENVHVFANQVETKTLILADQRQVKITGFSYGRKWIQQEKVSEYPLRGNADFWIGMLHGQVKSGHADNYAPFTVDQLLSRHYDYWALGHIHHHQQLNDQPPIVYCGNPQGRHINEAGPHGCYLVEEEGRQLVPRFRAVSVINWENLDVMITADDDQRSLRTKVVNAAEQLAAKRPQRLIMVNIRLHLSATTDLGLDSTDFLEQLQAGQSHAPNLIWWPASCELVGSTVLPQLTDADRQYWQAAANQVFQPKTLQDLVINDKNLSADYLRDQLADPDFIKELRQTATTLLGRRQSGDENS